MVLYGLGLASMVVWPGLARFDEAILLTALGAACLINLGWNRTYHCGITGPLFLAGALAIGAAEADVLQVDSGLVWGLVLAGVGIAAILEARFAVKSGRKPTA